MKITLDLKGQEGYGKSVPEDEDVMRACEVCLEIKRRIGKLADLVEVIEVEFWRPSSAASITTKFKTAIVGPIGQKIEMETYLGRWENYPRLQPVGYLAEEFMDRLRRNLKRHVFDLNDDHQKFSKLVAALG